MEITKEQKERILALDPDFFKAELEVDKWYKVRRNNFISKEERDAIVFFQGQGIQTYGFEHRESWVDNYGSEDTFNQKEYTYAPATRQEVENALIIEAKKRGYKKGNFISLGTGKISNYDACKVVFDNNNNKFWNEYGLVFEKGKWAEILETITKAEAEKLLNKIII
jgi:hypothetical protein